MLLSIAILFLDLTFVWINYSSSKNALNHALEKAGNTAKDAFKLSLDLVSKDLQKIAAFIAKDEQIQDLFLKGKKAVLEEGGGAGGDKASKIRNELY